MGKLYEPREISEITGVDKQVMRKLLHDYEDIVKPSDYKNYPADGRKGYKLYDADSVDKLYQIVIYRELGLGHNAIKAIFSNPAYDPSKALSEQLNSLKEKRERINRQIDAVERMQALGVKNGILQLILPNGKIKGFVDGGRFTNSQQLDAIIENSIEDDSQSDAFLSQIEPVWASFAQLDDSLCESAEGMALIEEMISVSKRAFGFIGYANWVAVAISVHGEGTLWREINDGLDIPISIRKYQAIYHWLIADAKSFDEEIRDLARKHNCIGLPFHHKRSISFVADVRTAAREHFALESDDEYMLIFSSMSIPPYKQGSGYAIYTLNALTNDISRNQEK